MAIFLLNLEVYFLIHYLKQLAMSKNINTSEQQSQHVTIGTQGNNDQVTPLGEMHPDQKSSEAERQIPNQDRSSAANQERTNSNRDQEK
jgi:hypothetical protein